MLKNLLLISRQIINFEHIPINNKTHLNTARIIYIVLRYIDPNIIDTLVHIDNIGDSFHKHVPIDINMIGSLVLYLAVDLYNSKGEKL